MNKNYLLIILLSIAVPILVTFLIFSPEKSGLGDWIKLLPHLHGMLNSATALVLLFALLMIKRGNVKLHRLGMTTAFILGAIFLVSYIIYHSSAPSVIYGDFDSDGVLSSKELLSVGAFRMIYICLLLSHIGLSVVVIPLVLLAFYFALNDQIDRHKRIVKFAWPIWFYVSGTGVLVYLMIRPFYT